MLKACQNTPFLSRPFSKWCKIRVPPFLNNGKCDKIRAPPLTLYSKCRNLRNPSPLIRALKFNPELHFRALNFNGK